MHRGINRMQIFDEDDDYEVFLKSAIDATRSQAIDVHSFTLMPNHYHLQVTSHDPMAIPLAMKELHSAYTGYYNLKHRRTGTIWGTRYRPVMIEDELHWIKCLRYIEQNPVRAGVVEKPEDYRWSSYRVNALGESSLWLVPHSVYLALGASPRERQVMYRELCATPLTGPEIAAQRRPSKSRPSVINVRTIAGVSAETAFDICAT